MEDIRKSLHQIIYERTTSPFYGTLITSWFIWNWKIPYLTFFISQDKITSTKIDYIVSNYLEIEYILILPLLSALILLTIIPFFSNGAYWLSLKFNKWKIDQKNIIDKKILLSVEQSIELREQFSKQEERFAKLVDDKNLEIKQLNLQIENFQQEIPLPTLEDVLSNNSKIEDEDSELQNFSERLKSNKNEMNQYENVINYIQRDYSPVDKSDVESKFITLLEAYNIIARKSNGTYEITDIGRKFYKIVNK